AEERVRQKLAQRLQRDARALLAIVRLVHHACAARTDPPENEEAARSLKFFGARKGYVGQPTYSTVTLRRAPGPDRRRDPPSLPFPPTYAPSPPRSRSSRAARGSSRRSS